MTRFLFALALSLLAAAVVAQNLRGKVVGVSDGDTLTVRDGDTKTTIRLAEIDAPERTQPYSQVSRRNLETLCRNAKSVETTPMKACRTRGC